MNIVDVFGFRFDRDSGIMYDPVMEETGFTFFDSYTVGPGFDKPQPTGVTAFLSKESSTQLATKIKVKYPDYKVEVVDTDTKGVFKIVDRYGKEVPQYQIKISDKNGNFTRLNAGLIANQIMRNPRITIEEVIGNDLPKGE